MAGGTRDTSPSRSAAIWSRCNERAGDRVDGVDPDLSSDLVRMRGWRGMRNAQAVAGAGRLAVSLYAVTVVAGSRSHLYRTTLIVERTCS